MSKNVKQAAVDWMTVLKTLIGGGLLGGGVGAATGLARHLSNLNDKVKAQQDTSKDDDILYVNLPAKRAGKEDRNTAGTFAMAGLAGLMGTYGAYNLVRDVYSKMRKRELQKEIDQSQQAYIGGLSGTKEASGQFSGITTGVGSAYLAGLLSILGSAIITNKILQKQFPAIKSPLRNRPRKIVIRQAPDEQGMDKTIPVEDASPEAMENVVRMNLENGKSASVNELEDVVCAVANGRADELLDVLYSNSPDGVDTMLDLVKGAGFEKVSSVNRNLAITWICTDPVMSKALAPVVAAEHYSWNPYCKMASFIDPAFHDDLVGIAESVAAGVRKEAFAPLISKLPDQLVKKASEESIFQSPMVNRLLVADAIKRMILENPQQGRVQAQNQTPDKPISTDNSGSASEDSTVDPSQPAKGKTVIEAEDDDSSDFLQNNKDVIDEALTRTS